MKFKLLIILMLSALFLTGCVSSWYGTGKVLDKSYTPSHLQYYGKNMWMNAPACYRLMVRDYNGDDHTGCVKQHVWDGATIGESIKLTEETAS